MPRTLPLMQRINWVTTIFLLLTPAIAVVWGGIHVARHGVQPAELAFFAIFLVATGLSITAGYHRLFAHGAYDCNRFVKAFFVFFGAGAFQQSILKWASDHRRHHRFIDQEKDPYNIREGFLWAHIGWMLVDDEPTDYSNVPDLAADPLIAFQDRYYVLVASVMCFFLPLGIGYLIGNPWGLLLWAGVIRMVVVHHSTFFVNSLAHTLGRRPYSVDVSARDSVITALLTFGEGYHNFHHRFATDYRNGVRRHQWDPTKWLIRGMAAMGWAWDLYRTPREKIVEAELEADRRRVSEGLQGRSEQAMAYVRERLTEVGSLVEAAARKLGELERQLAAARQSLGDEGRRQVERLRAELRQARREFREARSRWRTAISEALSEAGTVGQLA